ncbi:MAG TPA: RNA polymerase sigma factor [Acidimicrobiales bacterium]|nr:RNA polymerase sigma factor [Acidimicrobiales bacterium]
MQVVNETQQHDVLMDSGGDFSEVFRREFPRLAGYCAGLVGDRDMGADLAQEAMARTWSRWSGVADPRAYSYLVATNLARRQWKARSRERQAGGGLTGPGSVSDPLGEVRDLVDRLPERLRTATLLHYYADLPVEQVARLLHRPEGTIRQRLHEARRLLALELRKED